MPVFFGQNYATIPGYGGFGDGDTEPPDAGPVWEVVGEAAPRLILSIPAAASEGGGTLPDPGLDGPAVSWRPVVFIDGVDVSELTIGAIEVRAAEGAARVASFSLLFAPGQAIALSTWTGHAVEIDYARLMNGEIAARARLFTGIIDTPEFDAATGMIRILATDDLQGELDAMTDAQIDALAGGRWSAVVFDEARSHGGQRARDRMSARTASLDLDVWRTPRVTPWFAAASLPFTADDIEDGSLSATFAGRSSLINRVVVAFDYRTPLARARTYGVSFDSVAHAAGKYGGGGGFGGVQYATWASYIKAGHVILTKAAVESAISSAGAEIAQMSWINTPASYAEPGVDDWVWVKGPNDDLYLCRGFTAQVTFNSGGEMEENHVITVDAPLSIAQAGVLESSLSGSLEGAYPEQTQVETQMAVNRVLAVQSIPPRDYATAAAGLLTSVRATLTPETDRAAANAAMACLIDMAKVRIADAHRQNEVTASVLLAPDVDTARHVRVDTPRIKATGKVKAVTHRLDADSGRAVTTFTLAVSSLCGVGIVHPETPTAAPDAPALAAKPAGGSTRIQFNSGPKENHEFSVEFPGMAEADRALLVKEILSSALAAVHEDEFEVIT
jgi:hypothetical protein